MMRPRIVVWIHCGITTYAALVVRGVESGVIPSLFNGAQTSWARVGDALLIAAACGISWTLWVFPFWLLASLLWEEWPPRYCLAVLPAGIGLWCANLLALLPHITRP
mgnify:CR=1 FL=1